MVATKLEKSVFEIIRVYHEYSRKKEGWDELNLKELTQIIKNEYPVFLSTCSSADPDGYIKNYFDEYKNKNNEVNFNAYMKIMGKMANIYHKRSHNDETCDDRK
ncbi:protein S100-A15A-like [Gracilinanus agilis]|uniref:protein S100-A15A-like n=1 Tax=Gracilinanus agilis TaxID=191870 RepID=UPI001CFCF40C|nr:protein S100-A15A-like [Gracilinanus agilis]